MYALCIFSDADIQEKSPTETVLGRIDSAGEEMQRLFKDEDSGGKPAEGQSDGNGMAFLFEFSRQDAAVPVDDGNLRERNVAQMQRDAVEVVQISVDQDQRPR